MKRKNSRIKRILCLAFCAAFLFSGVPHAEAAEYVPHDLIDDADLTGRIEQVLGEHPGEISIGYYYSASGESWYYNADVWAYSASLYKVPNCMLLEEKENAGEITQDTPYCGFTIAQQEYAAIVNSDNDRGHDIVRFNGGAEYGDKCSFMFKKYTDLPDDYFTEDKFVMDSWYTARFYQQILVYLYEHADEYPHVIELMKQTQPGHYLHRMSDDRYEIAQKYGEYTGKPEGVLVYHAAGIIYTPNPIVVTIMTKGAGYDEQRFGAIADVLTDYTLYLDSLAEEQAALAAAEPEPTEEPQPTPQPTPEPAPQLTPQPTPEPVIRHTKQFPILPAVFAGIAIACLGGALALKFKPEKSRKKSQKYTPKH